MSEQDRVFLRRFSVMMAALVLVFIALLIVASLIGNVLEPKENPARQRAIAERIEPVGDVYVGEAPSGAADADGAADASEPAESGAAGAGAAGQEQTAEAQQGAFGGTKDAEMIYNRVCSTCHAAGVAGAPAMTAEAWSERREKGVDTLVQHAVQGFQGNAGYMPAKGGRPDLTEEQVRVTVEWMLAQVEE